MKNRQHQWRVQLLFCDRSKHPDAAIAELQYGFAHGAFLVPHLDPVQPLNLDLGHLVGHGVVAFAGKPVDTRSQQEVGSGLMGD